MFLNILRISAANVLKMLLNIIVSIGCAFDNFHSLKPTRSTHVNKLQATLAGKKER